VTGATCLGAQLTFRRRLRAGTAPERLLSAQRIARRVYRALEPSGYARVDLRLDAAGEPWILEANPNPDLCFGEDFAESFEQVGYRYPQLLQKLLNLGMRYHAPWMG
ncbi:MAG: hypothetical protein ABGY29_08190, partial [bacterium]